jgi:VanZ family protein
MGWNGPWLATEGEQEQRPMISTRALALLWTALVLVAHSIPRSQLERVPGAKELVNTSGPDKIVHIVMFMIFGLLWLRCAPRRPLAILAAGIAYGFALEVYQGWLILGRNYSLADALCDAVGIALGIAVARRLDSHSPPVLTQTQPDDAR